MYSNIMTWENWRDLIGNYGYQLTNLIEQSKLQYDKWYDLTYGLTDVQILALPQFSTMTQAELTQLKYAIGVFNDLYSVLYGSASLPQADRHGYFVSFIGGN